jgi:hypothetical protein
LQIIKNGEKYVIYGDAVSTFTKLPAKKNNYEIGYERPPFGIGFFLKESDKFKPVSGKVYGNFEEKTSQILEAYKKSKKSIGVLLSGDKGLGKTLFAKLLAQKAQEAGMPVILANKGYKGIGAFLSNIKQDSMILFDEFEKNFSSTSVDNSDLEMEKQSSMLSVFDGVAEQKHLYVITVNNLFDLSEYFLNRPGRFMYSIRLEYPSTEEIKEYLQDNLSKKAKDQIGTIVKFSFRVPLNYDTLDAIVFQLNSGFKFKNIINDLNIMNIGRRSYSIKLVFKNGYSYTEPYVSTNLFEKNVEVNAGQFNLKFKSHDLSADNETMVVSGDKAELGELGDTLSKNIKHGFDVDGLDHVEIKAKQSSNFKFEDLD